MAWARSESIFCWPRSRADFFLRFFEDDALFEVFAAADVFLCVPELGAADFFVESSCATAAESNAQPTTSAQTVPKRALRIGDRSLIIRCEPSEQGTTVQKQNTQLRAGTVIMLDL
ncbi:MAG TPA: hypothetical protein VFO46_09080 [Candidatus Sulfotelmatobacter sp.]|nr:hypothetical protein [Candidatus Sulfotelmatobacter sp.]